MDRNPALTAFIGGILSVQLATAAEVIGPEQRYARTEGVLQHFSVPAEPDSGTFLEPYQDVRTLDQVRERLPFLDPAAAFNHYANLSSNALSAFRDPDGKTVEDFTVRLAPEPAVPASDFEIHLARAAREPDARRLAGLRIALDPGHMGSELWDLRTGKYIIDDRTGRKLSEGELNLEVSLLLEKKLQALGAQTMITHRTLEPVTALPFATFDLQPYELRDLKESTLDPWFTGLLPTGPAGPALYAAFIQDRDFQSLFSGALERRLKSFILEADLDARVQMIRDFQPDLTLVIHFDTMNGNADPHGVNKRGYDATKAYVPGGFFPNEFASREDRRYFTEHLLDAHGWEASLQLGTAIVEAFNQRMGIPLERDGDGVSTAVRPGIFARNLKIPHQLPGFALSYVECLFYNDAREFEALSKVSGSLDIGGRHYGYSDRLLEVVDSLEEGVVTFVKNREPLPPGNPAVR